jgi:hypothetical protein
LITVKFTPLLAKPPTLTTTLPVLAPLGTGATMLVVLQLVGVAVVPLNLTVLVPCVVPKFVPVMVTEAPTVADAGFRLVMLGAEPVTVKLTLLLATPPTVTTTFPVVAPVGTGVTMLVALQLVGVAVVPLNVTVLVVPCVEPKFVPVIVTDAPTTPELGLKLVMFGVVGAAVPVPVNRIDMETIFALFEIFRLPVRVPVTVGEKVTLAVQVPDVPRGDEAMQLSVSEKSPLAVRASTLRLSGLTLVRVSCWAGLEVPTLCEPNVREAGETASLAGETLTGMDIWRDCPEIAYLTVIEALPPLAAVTVPDASTVATAVFDDK